MSASRAPANELSEESVERPKFTSLVTWMPTTRRFTPNRLTTLRTYFTHAPMFPSWAELGWYRSCSSTR